MTLEDIEVGKHVRLRNGAVLKVTDKVDATAPEVQENPDDLCIGEFSDGAIRVFTPSEAVAIW